MKNRFTKAEEARIHNESVIQLGLLDLARMEVRLNEVLSQNTSLNIEVVNLKNEKEDVVADLIKVQADFGSLQRRNEELKNDIRNLEADVEHYKNDRNYYQRKYESTRAAKAAEEAAQTKLETVVASTTQAHAQMLAELRAEKEKLLQAQIAAKVNFILFDFFVLILILLSHLPGS